MAYIKPLASGKISPVQHSADLIFSSSLAAFYDRFSDSELDAAGFLDSKAYSGFCDEQAQKLAVPLETQPEQNEALCSFLDSLFRTSLDRREDAEHDTNFKSFDEIEIDLFCDTEPKNIRFLHELGHRLSIKEMEDLLYATATAADRQDFNKQEWFDLISLVASEDNLKGQSPKTKHYILAGQAFPAMFEEDLQIELFDLLVECGAELSPESMNKAFPEYISYCPELFEHVITKYPSTIEDHEDISSRCFFTVLKLIQDAIKKDQLNPQDNLHRSYEIKVNNTKRCLELLKSQGVKLGVRPDKEFISFPQIIDNLASMDEIQLSARNIILEDMSLDEFRPYVRKVKSDLGL